MSYAAETEQQAHDTFHHKYMVNQILANILNELFRKGCVTFIIFYLILLH